MGFLAVNVQARGAAMRSGYWGSQASPTFTVTVPVPSQPGQGLPPAWPEPPHRGQMPSAVCSVPGGASSSAWPLRAGTVGGLGVEGGIFWDIF